MTVYGIEKSKVILNPPFFHFLKFLITVSTASLFQTVQKAFTLAEKDIYYYSFKQYEPLL